MVTGSPSLVSESASEAVDEAGSWGQQKGEQMYALLMNN